MYRALVSFSGLVTMAMGQIGDIPDEAIAKELLRVGYIEEATPEAEAKPKKAKKKKGADENES